MKRPYFYILLIVLGLYSCAIQQQPTGGPEDKTPPKILKEGSSPNFQTQFAEDGFEIKFDEYIDFRNALKSTIISPPLSKNPKIEVFGKKLKVKFDKEETLKENATYVFNFQDGLKDFTNNNAYEDLRFVFSTGDFIDSLSINGLVLDAKTKEPLENIIVALYANLSDTAVYKQKPFYLSNTDENGKFTIKNIRQDTFRIYALQDNNVNYKYDPESESFGFLDSLMIIDVDSMQNIKLEISQKETPLKITESLLKKYGRFAIAANHEIKSAKVSTNFNLDHFLYQTKNDSIIGYYSNEIDTAFSLFVEIDETIFDTLKIRKLKREDYLGEASLKVVDDNLTKSKGLSPSDTLTLTFNTPIEKIDSLFQFYQDSILLDVEHSLVPSDDKNKVKVIGDWVVDSTFNFRILPATFTDIHGVKNDSISFRFTQNDITKYGNILITLDSTEVERNMVFELWEKKKRLKTKNIIYNTFQEFKFLQLAPGSYSLIYFIDINKNGKWDAADFESKQQAEFYKEIELEELRENWDLELKLTKFDFQ